MIKSEVGYASTNDYFSRKTRSDRQEFAETTEIIGEKLNKYITIKMSCILNVLEICLRNTIKRLF